MEVHNQKTNLSFSIENILRDDFPRQRRTVTNAVNLPLSAIQPRINRRGWPGAQLFRYYAVRYNPVFVRLLPNVHRMGARLHPVSGVKELILSQQPERKEEERLRFDDEKDEEISQQKDDETEEKNVSEKSESEKCLKEKAPQKKRRNRSHFTQRQLQYLEKIFSRQQYLTRDERTLLARGLEMTELQIRNWFQNRRYQKKHRANEDTKQEKPDSSTCEEAKV